MPPKTKKGKHVDPTKQDAHISKLVEAIEGKLSAKGQPGMTKKQAAAAQDKIIEAMNTQLTDARRRVPYTDQQLQLAFQLQQEQRRREILAAQYVNVPVALPTSLAEWHSLSPDSFVRYVQFDGSNEMMEKFVDIFTRELSEPYNNFTHQHFVFGWPDLALGVYVVKGSAKPEETERGAFAGAAVSKVSRKGPHQPLRGYIAMLAVEKEFRGHRLGSRLVTVTKELMDAKGCDLAYLETPIANGKALKLYTDLGFAKVKFLPSYYLDGSDAVRLKLWLKPLARLPVPPAATAPAAENGDHDQEVHNAPAASSE